ncbi:MAG: hypothetical protein HFE62_05910 [Firmicutes bacterium]|nr:hypothetical protein [Bacillota bacterium]
MKNLLALCGIIMITLSFTSCAEKNTYGETTNDDTDKKILSTDIYTKNTDTEDTNTTNIVEYEHNYAKISLELPCEWEHSITEYSENENCFGITFWPKTSPEGKINFFFYKNFGVCGTELSIETIEFENGNVGYKGTYDGHNFWNFIQFQNASGSYVATTECDDTWWEKYETEVMSILENAQIENDITNEENAFEISMSNSENKKSSRKSHFDFETYF